MVLTHGIPPTLRDGVHLQVYRQPPSDQSQVYRAMHLRTDSSVPCRESAGTGPVVMGSHTLYATASIYYIPSTAIGSLPRSSGHANAYRRCSLPRVRRHRASSPQGSSSDWSYLSRYLYGPFFVCLPFPTPTIGLCSEHMCDI